VQGFPEEELSFGESLDGANRHEHLQNMGDSSLGNDQRRVLLTFPAGEADAVTITERDMEGLQPFEYLSNNIIDFYIK
jgi:Ulp1 family protease